MSYEGRCIICGIAGYIGRSKHPSISFELITALFSHLEIRGDDASGYWGTEVGQQGRILYHKEPTKSSDFITKPIWQNVAGYDTDLLLVHARGASQGVGIPGQNKNNHPFVSEDRTVGLIHNGRIPDAEYNALKNKYKVKTECDSEILLRIFQGVSLSGETQAEYDDPDEWGITRRLHGIKDVWSHVVRGHMTVGIGEWLQGGNRRLWLFRNRHRTLWLVDMRKYLGQIFFCSTPEIWQKAAQDCRSVRPFVRKRIKLVDLPIEEAWVMRTSATEEIPENVRKFVISTGSYSTFEHKGDAVGVAAGMPPVPIITGLDDEDLVLDKAEIKKKENKPWRCPTVNVPSNFQSTPTGGIRLSTSPARRSLADLAESISSGNPMQPFRQQRSERATNFLDDLEESKEKARIKKIEADLDNMRKRSPAEYGSTPDSDLPSEAFMDAAVALAFSTDESSLSVDREDEKMLDILTGEVRETCLNLRELIDEIESVAWNKSKNSSFSASDLKELVESLEQAGLDLSGTLQILNSN